MKKIGITAALSMFIAGMWMAGCGGGTPNCDAYVKAIDDCCAKSSADANACTTLKSTAKAAQDAAKQLGTDCGTATFTCPYM